MGPMGPHKGLYGVLYRALYKAVFWTLFSFCGPPYCPVVGLLLLDHSLTIRCFFVIRWHAPKKLKQASLQLLLGKYERGTLAAPQRENRAGNRAMGPYRGLCRALSGPIWDTTGPHIGSYIWATEGTCMGPRALYFEPFFAFVGCPIFPCFLLKRTCNHFSLFGTAGGKHSGQGGLFENLATFPGFVEPPETSTMSRVDSGSI